MKSLIEIPAQLFITSLSPVHLDCTICGAMVTYSNKEKHRKFHEVILISLLPKGSDKLEVNPELL